MPRRRINISKLFELKRAQVKLALLEEAAWQSRQARFPNTTLRKFQRGCDRAWWSYRKLAA